MSISKYIRKSKRPVHRTALILLLTVSLAIGGCSAPKALVQYAPPADVNTRYASEANGFQITVDPIFDEERSKQFFGTNVLGMGVLPIYIRAENTNQNTSFLLRKQNLQLVLGSAQDMGISAREVKRDSTAASVVGTVGLAAISVPLIFTGTLMIARNLAIQHNFVQAEMRDQTLSVGQAVSGFAYFHLPKGHPPSGGVLKVTVTDLRSGQNSQIEIRILNETFKR